jgi:hypothetical protein
MGIVGLAGNMIVVGLEEKNIERMKSGAPFHQYLEHTIGIPYQLTIFYGKTAQELVDIIQDNTGPAAVIIDERNRRKS